MDSNRPTKGFYLAYLERYGERNRLKRENHQVGNANLNSDAEVEEKYWRDRERHQRKRQQFKKVA